MSRRPKDMSENRIRVRVEPELTPTRLEDKMDVNAEIDVGVDTHLKGLGVAGAVCVGVGFVALLAAALMFLFGYPTPWYGTAADGEHVAYVKTVVLLGASAVVFLFFGTSAFFYGRTVLGSGHMDQFATSAVEIGQEGA
ncbi:MAG: hypothetical protein ABR562_05800 [Thermoplasmatota archaeon]